MMDFGSIERSIESFIQKHDMTDWVVQVFLVILLTAFINAFSARLVNRLISQAAKTRNFWDDVLLKASQSPLRLLVWTVGIGFAGDIILHETHTTLFTAINPLRIIGVVGALVWFVVRFAREAEFSLIADREARGESVDLATVQAIGRLIRVSVLITGVLIALQSLGFSISGILAFGGIGGIAIGFAAKDILANFFGGLMLYLDRPFVVGDWINAPDRQIEGTVEDIGWRLTRIRCFDKRPVYVPNSMFASMAVINPSRMSHRRIYETVGIRYEDIGAMEAIVGSVESMLRKREDIDTSQTLMVYFTAFNQSSCDFIIYAFVRTTNWSEYLATKQEILLNVANIIEAHGAEIAFPTRTIQIISDHPVISETASP